MTRCVNITRLLAVVALSLNVAISAERTRIAEPRPAFVGYMTDGETTLLAVLPKNRSIPIWLPVGVLVEGHIVEEFDSTLETILIVTEGERFRLRLEGSANRGGRHPSPVLERSSALAIARKAVDERERWKNPRLHLSQRPKGDYQVLVFNRSPGITERRVLLISPSGEVKSYLPLPNQLHGGIPDILFEPFSSSVERHRIR
jgi:hypothetical protein